MRGVLNASRLNLSSNSQFGFVVTTSVVVGGQKATEVATTGNYRRQAFSY